MDKVNKEEENEDEDEEDNVTDLLVQEVSNNHYCIGNNSNINDDDDADNDDDDENDADDDDTTLNLSNSCHSSNSSCNSNSNSNSNSSSLIGILFIIFGSLCFSCMFLFVKFMNEKANSFSITFYRSFIEIPIALCFCVWNQEHPFGPSISTTTNTNTTTSSINIRLWLLIRGAFGGGAVLCFFYSIQKLSLPDAVTIQFTTPPFAAMFAICFVGEQWLKIDKLGAIICLLGVMLIAHPTWLFPTNDQDDNDTMDTTDTTTTTTIPILVAVLGAAFAGMAYMSVRKIGHLASANVMVFYYSCCSLPVTFIASKLLLNDWNVWSVTTTSTTDSTTNFTYLDWCYMLFTGIFAYTGQYFTNLGLQRETAAKGTLATCTQIVFTYIFELTILHESINMYSIIGTILILSFIVIVTKHKMNMNHHQQQQQQQQQQQHHYETTIETGTTITTTTLETNNKDNDTDEKIMIVPNHNETTSDVVGLAVVSELSAVLDDYNIEPEEELELV